MHKTKNRHKSNGVKSRRWKANAIEAIAYIKRNNITPTQLFAEFRSEGLVGKSFLD